MYGIIQHTSDLVYTYSMEKEYTFSIPRSTLHIKPKNEIGKFKCVFSEIINITDLLFEREGKSLKKEKVGLRIRKQNGRIELTCKKFLERIEGMVKYKERNFKLTQEEYNRFKHGDFVNCKYQIIKDLQIHGKLFVNMLIKNKRYLYRYKNQENIIDLTIEDLSFSRGNKSVDDAMIEIEIIETSADNSSIVDFVEKIQKSYKAIPSSEGKNTRGEKLISMISANIKQPLIESASHKIFKNISAHNGTGLIKMKFFHQEFQKAREYSNLPKPNPTYKKTNWNFIAYAELPVGSTIGEHVHQDNDEIYFILDGEATLDVDGNNEAISAGDIVLTRAGSRHSVYNVTKTLKFYAIEILQNDE